MQAHTVLLEAVDAGTDLRYSACAGGAGLHMTRCAALPHGAGAHPSLPRELPLSAGEAPGSVPFWHVMPWSLHFAARKRKSAKKRGRRPGENPCRRAPTPSPPTLTLSVPIHFDSPIKEFPCLRTLPTHPPASAPPENLPSNTGAAPRPCRLRPVPAEREKNRPVASAAALV